MPRFEPFTALRYAPGTDLDAVIAPPYDVLSDADVAALRARSGHNVVHVDVPAGEGPQRYADAAARLRAWVAEGVLVEDPEPAFTIYRMRFTDDTGTDRDLAGVLGALEVVDEGAGGVLPHERTTKKASTDRLDLTRSTDANLSPVWGLALGRGLTDALRQPGEPVGSLVVDGVTHAVERVVDAGRVAAIRAAVEGDDVLLADGHHRYGVARVLRDEVRAATGRTDTAAEATLAFVGELVPDQLAIEAIHRLWSGGDPAELRRALTRSFTPEPVGDGHGWGDPAADAALLREMARTGRLVLATADGLAWLAPRDGAFDGVRALDGARLEHALEGVAVDVAYQHGVAEVRDALASGRAHTAVLLNPVGIEEIERTGREHLLMPPKSTFFTPKLRTGLVVRPLRTREETSA